MPATESDALASDGDVAIMPAPAPVECQSTHEETQRSYLVDGLLPDSINPKSFNAYAEHLIKIDWAVIGWLTWANESRTRRSDASEHKRRKDFYWLLGTTCGYHKLRPRHLMFYHKAEYGNRRGHYNFFIGRQGTEKVSPDDLARTMERFWNKGMAVVRPFDPAIAKEGVDYQTKYEFDRDGHARLHPENLSPRLQAELRRLATN